MKYHMQKEASKCYLKINMKYKQTKKSVFLSHNFSKALLVPPRIWSSIEFLNNQSVVLVLTDYEYDFKDYIETYEEFLTFQKRNK